MFRIGDIVTLNLERKSKKLIRWRIGEFRELQGTVMLQEVDNPLVIETLPKYMVLDVNYMRKMKLTEICSKLVI